MPSRDRSISPSRTWLAGPNDIDISTQGAPDQQEPTSHSLLSAAINALDISQSLVHGVSPPSAQSLHSAEPRDQQPLEPLVEQPTPKGSPQPTKSKPIDIPKPGGAQYSLSAFDPDRVPTNTPLTARGSRKGFFHYYPYPRSPSPPDRRYRAFSDSYKDISVSNSYTLDAAHRRRNSTSSTHTLMFAMHSDQYAGRYTPTSPLSPQIPSSGQPISHQSAKRSAHARQTSRSMHMPLPRFHPMAYPHHGQAASPTSTVQSPAIALNGVHAAQPVDSPRMMRQKHREFLDSAKAMSAQAASPASNKPTSPRLDPLGSPKGPVTPLALEEGSDYFTVKRASKPSPAASPGAKSVRSDGEDKAKNKRHIDVYQ